MSAPKGALSLSESGDRAEGKEEGGKAEKEGGKVEKKGGPQQLLDGRAAMGSPITAEGAGCAGNPVSHLP